MAWCFLCSAHCGHWRSIVISGLAGHVVLLQGFTGRLQGLQAGKNGQQPRIGLMAWSPEPILACSTVDSYNHCILHINFITKHDLKQHALADMAANSLPMARRRATQRHRASPFACAADRAKSKPYLRGQSEKNSTGCSQRQITRHATGNERCLISSS